ncbi:MAG: MFS transporter [Streptococcaceae bacterium]|jgi:DHA1 family multidrug resistance protein B-like MFS transporter|nr:MFS transporter [Streptococcaceae bacterium]
MKDFLALNRNLQLRLLIVFLGAFSYGAVFSSMTIYYNHNMGASVTGIILIISSIVTFLAGLVAGHFADKVGRHLPMLIGALLEFIGAVIALVANSPLLFDPWLTFLAFLFVSFGYNCVVTTGNAMIIDLAEIQERKIVFALDYWAANLSAILGAALGAWLFRDHFFDLLLILVAGTAVTFLIIRFFITESIHKSQLAPKEENIFQTYRDVLKDKTYMIFMAANILAASIIMQFDNFLPIHLADEFQPFNIFGVEIYGQRMFTIFLVVACVLVVIFMTEVNRLFANISHQKAFVIGTLFMTAGMVLSFLTTSFWPVFIAAFIYTFGEIVYTPAIQVLGAEMMDPDKIGAYNGVGAMRQPVASIVASLTVTISPIIKDTGVSAILVVIEILAIYLLLNSVKQHELSQH